MPDYVTIDEAKKLGKEALLNDPELAAKAAKYQKSLYLERLVEFANSLGYDVELDSMMEGHEKLDDDGKIILNEKGYPLSPAGDCNWQKQLIRVRGGKSKSGQIATMIHELAHALGLGGLSYLSWAGEAYIELAAESVTQIVTQAIGIDRTEKTASRIAGYGFNGYLVSPVTMAISSILYLALKGESIAKQ